jgi:L,D-peptidoglycan transpeptidase YkuD (ErfK/YbiS/YcfS/YnhG family)
VAIRLALAACAAVAAAALTLPTALGWTSAPTWSRECARRALAGAREAGASRWAPDALAVAETHARAVDAEIRRQASRPFPWRDYRAARRLLDQAETTAWAATRRAVDVERETSASATGVVDTAACVIARLRPLQRSHRFGHDTGEWMRTAELRLHEAEYFVRFGEFDRARLSAQNALDAAGRVRQRMLDGVARFVDADQVVRWRSDRDETIAWSRRTGQAAIVVNKDTAALTLYAGGKAVRTYDVDLGQNDLRRKLTVGDDATPEGRYRIESKRGPGRTLYHKALGIDYPNEQDRRRHRDGLARSLVPAGSNPGALIEIHGDGGRGSDWTNGCVALRNDDMDDLFRRVAVGTPVTLIGGDGDGGRFSTLAERLRGEEIESACRTR